MSRAAPFDPGLQPERTLLAWRRTTLALAIGALTAGRLLLPEVGLWAPALALVGTVCALTAYLHASQRYRAAHESLSGGGVLPGGGLPFLMLALGVLSAGVLASIGVLALAG